MRFDISLEGIQRVQQKNLHRIASMKPLGKVANAVRSALVVLHRHAVQITHVGKYPGGGALKNSHRIGWEGGLEGVIYIDPQSVSPRRSSRKYRPAEYGIYENARGGEHAFYDRTVAEVGENAKDIVVDAIIEDAINGE